MLKTKHIAQILIFILVFVTACSHDYMPKPHGYMRVGFPPRAFQTFDSAGYPYKFVYPKYCRVTKDSSRIAKPWWVDVEFVKYNAKVHISYHDIRKDMSEMLEDVHNLAYKHAVKADAIKKVIIEDESRKMWGLIYDIRGNSASSLQFFLTDSTRHFLRGALYFNVTPNIDSLQPIIDHFRVDIDTLIRSVRWKEN
jgi:gliding motility-associated lipoprotein GldD